MSKLQEILAEVGLEVGYIQKDGTNEIHRYRYATAEAVLGKVNEALFSRKVAVSSTSDLVHFGQDDKGYMAVVRTTLTFRLDEESHQVVGLGSGWDSRDKAVMKANTASIKYALAAAFLISWGDDPEADSKTDKLAGAGGPRGKEKTFPSFAQVKASLEAAQTDGEIRNIRAGLKGVKFTREEIIELDRVVASKMV